MKKYVAYHGMDRDLEDPVGVITVDDSQKVVEADHPEWDDDMEDYMKDPATDPLSGAVATGMTLRGLAMYMSGHKFVPIEETPFGGQR